MIKIFLFLLIFNVSYTYAQTTPSALQTVTAKLSTYTSDHITEKTYLQFDKPYYAAGDTIYFKAYLTLGGQHKLSALSGILHAELIGPDGRISKSEKLQVRAGTAWGDFALADTIRGGNYRVRAYTSWMRNNGDDSFFEQTIAVGSISKKKIAEGGERPHANKTAKTTPAKADVQFLPEGGSLVAGNYSKVAFKAIGMNGAGIAIRGTVTDDAGTEVCTFASSHLGMGAFTLVPEQGKTYKANITYEDGTTGTIELPKAINTGYTISINNADPDNIRIRVTAGSGSPADKLSLVAQCGGTVCYAAESGPFNKFFTAVIPKNKFPTGIAQFTLFNEAGEPLNERLVFVNKKDELNMQLNTAKQSYHTREKIKIALNAKNKESQPVTGSFSVAVTDETTVQPDTINESTILSSLLLTSDLKGTVEQPNYYFSNSSEQTAADLDLLMLTQGYRYFDWKQVLSSTPPAISYQPEKTLQISGTVKRGSKPAAGAKVKLFSNSGGMFMLDTVADVNGRFAFKDLVFADSTKFVVQSKVAKGQDDVTLYLDSASAPVVTAGHPPINATADKSSAANMSAYMINQKQFYNEQLKYGINKTSIVLQEVKVEAKKEPIIPHSENLNGSGNADQVLTAKDIERFICGRLADCLQGVLTQVSFKNGIAIHNGEMAIIIDGTFVDHDQFNDLHPDDIEGIEVILGPHFGAIYGSRAANGALIITTKRAKKMNEFYRYAPGVITYRPQGFYKAREFYFPKYDNPKTNQKITDLRSTIYWQPNIITDKDGNAGFEFFNADGKGTYRVVVEGIDADGNLGRQVYRYNVE